MSDLVPNDLTWVYKLSTEKIRVFGPWKFLVGCCRIQSYRIKINYSYFLNVSS